jgi:hypothetical protein
MKRRSVLLIGALALVALSGCRKKPQLTAPAPAASPTPSPAQDAIVYVHHGQLWMMKWDGSGAGVLASRPNASFWFPSASPKGDDLLAWVSHPDGSEDLARVFLDGRYELLTSMGESASAPMKNIRLGNAASYNSTASQIAYSYNGNIWVMSRDGYDAQTLISDGLSYSPVWSPDDKKIAYVNGKNGHYDLWVTDVSSHDTWQVTDFKDYSVGGPVWVSEGKRLMVTRSQKDESDIVTVLADTDVPLVDSDVLTKDNNSASGGLNKEGKYLVYSSAGPSDPKAATDAPAPVWDIWTADAANKESKRLSSGGGLNPCWIRPSVPSTLAAMPMTAPAPLAALPTPLPPRPALPAPAQLPTAQPQLAMQQAAVPPAPPMPQAQPTRPPLPQAQPAMNSQPNPAAPTPRPAAQAPGPSSAAAPQARPAQLASAPINTKPAPTQPPAKAPPLRVRLRVSFDPDNDQLVLSSLTELKKTAGRVRQYSGENISVYGPLDRSPLRGQYGSEDDRSLARAQQVAAQLAVQAKLQASSINALPYAPLVIGAASPNGIEVHVELK